MTLQQVAINDMGRKLLGSECSSIFVDRGNNSVFPRGSQSIEKRNTKNMT